MNNDYNYNQLIIHVNIVFLFVCVVIFISLFTYPFYGNKQIQ